MVPDPTVRPSEALTDLGRVLMQQLKLRTYPLLISLAGVMAAMGGSFRTK